MQGLATARAGAGAAAVALAAEAVAAGAVLLKAYVWAQAPPLRTLAALAAWALAAAVFRTGEWHRRPWCACP